MLVRLLIGILLGVQTSLATAPDVALSDITGHTVRPLAKTGRKATVYIFALSECPIANAYAPEIKRITEKYGKNGVSLSLVLVDPSLPVAKAKKYAKEFGYTMPVLLDPCQKLAKQLGITISPEVAVYDKSMRLVYRGRIDDQYFGLGQRRSVVTSHDLRNALEAVIARRSIKPVRTTAVGCTLPPPDPSNLKLRHNEGVVGRFLNHPRVSVDDARGAFFGKVGSGVDVVDPPA